MYLERPISIRVALVLAAALLCLVGAAAAEAPGQLTTVQSGTVSGDLYIAAYQPVPWGNQPASGVASREFTQAFALPAGAWGTNVSWARLYVSVYAGSASADWPLATTVSFDGDGDGTYETALGTETMQGIGYSTDGTVHVLNDHCNRVYSDYLAWYTVSGSIASTTPVARVRTEQIGSASYDGRLKGVALVVAYNDGDTDRVRYWISQGHAWVDVATAPTVTAFDTAEVPAGFTSARLSTLGLSSRDGTYTFNGGALAGANPIAPVNFLESTTWDVGSFVTAGTGSALSMAPGSGASSFKAVLAALAVRSPAPEAAPDLVVSSVVPNPGAGASLFANETNTIAVNVTNAGTGPAGASTVSVDTGGAVLVAPLGPLAAGASATVSVIDPGLRAGGTSIALTATVDAEGAVAESAEANNGLTASLTVYNNGYKGKRWTGGSDMITRASFDGKYDLFYSAGDSAYTSAKWISVTDTWTPADLPIPSGATVVGARLYQPYSYNRMNSDPAFTARFNGNTVSPVATYKDVKGFGSYNYPYGLYVYDVAGQFNAAGNTLVLTPEGVPGTTNDYALYGAYLVVVCSDSAASEKRIMLNDEFDMVSSTVNAATKYSTTDAEATVYAPFADVGNADLASATAIAVVASSSSSADVGKSRFFFNSNQFVGFWEDYLSGPQIGFSVYNVTAALVGGANEARLQSFDAGSGGDSFYAMNTILIVERSGAAPVIQVPGGALPPEDANGDGTYEDVNGNGRKDFADVVLFFNQMTWIAGNEPIPAFDYSRNGRIDFADVVWLFNNL